MMLACPHCGGHRLSPRRNPWLRFVLGPLAPRNLIQCRDCRAIYNPRTQKSSDLPPSVSQ